MFWRQRKNDRLIESWVVLCRSPIRFEVAELRACFDQVFPGRFAADRDDGSFVVGGPTPDPFMVKSLVPRASGLFMLLSGNEPYSGSPNASRIDVAARPAIAAHRAWFSIDLVQDFAEGNDIYAFISPAIAHLAPDHASVLLHPAQPIVLPFENRTRQRLAAGLTPAQISHPH